MSTQFNIVSSGDEAFITAFIPGEPLPLVTSRSANPRFDALLDIALDAVNGVEPDPVEVRDLFSPAKAVADKFEAISDRVLVANGRVLFDGTEIDNSLTNQIVRFLDEGSDFGPLVRFMENVMDNPNEHSRTQLYDWLNTRAFTISWDGRIVGYKGVREDSEYGYRSISSGHEPVYVENEAGEVSVHTGRIPNPLGSTVSMDRNLVQHDPSVGCHVGLHVGTYDYAKSFSGGTVLEVHVNPRDVVSVPTDCDWQKIRTCRYEVVDAIDEPYSTGLVDPDGAYDESDDYDWDDFGY